MKKWQVILIVILTFVLFAFVIYEYKSHADIKKANTGGYRFLECVSNCPIEYYVFENGTITNRTIFNHDCALSCSSELQGVPKKYTGFGASSNGEEIIPYEDKTIFTSEEYLSCMRLLYGEEDIVKFKNCLKEILPILKEKFSIP